MSDTSIHTKRMAVGTSALLSDEGSATRCSAIHSLTDSRYIATDEVTAHLEENTRTETTTASKIESSRLDWRAPLAVTDIERRNVESYLRSDMTDGPI